MTSARSKADQAQQAAAKALQDAAKARVKATEVAPEFFQPGADKNMKEVIAPKPAVMSNHVSPAYPEPDAKPLPPSIDNHVPHGGAQATARHLLARVGIGGPEGGSALPPPSIGPALVSAGMAGMRPVTDEKRPGSAPSSSHAPARHVTPQSAAAAAIAAFPDVIYDDYEVSDYVDKTTSQQTSSAPASKLLAERQARLAAANAANSDANRFSALLTPAVIADHFDQYETASAFGSLSSRRSDTSVRRGRIPFADGGPQRPSSRGSNPGNPNNPPGGGGVNGNPGGVNDIDDLHNDYQSRSRPIQRRQTLPPGEAALIIQQQQEAAAAARTRNQYGLPATTSSKLGQDSSGLYGHRNENGRAGGAGLPDNRAMSPSRNTSSSRGAVPATTAASRAPLWGGGGRGPTAPPPAVKPGASNSSLLRRPGNRGSMPDVSEGGVPVAGAAGGATMPREEVHMLSLMRREEIRRQREDEDRRRQQEVVVRLVDIKDWCAQRQLLVFVIAINVSIATLFLNML